MLPTLSSYLGMQNKEIQVTTAAENITKTIVLEEAELN
jgi:hypothetical protein